MSSESDVIKNEIINSSVSQSNSIHLDSIFLDSKKSLTLITDSVCLNLQTLFKTKTLYEPITLKLGVTLG